MIDDPGPDLRFEDVSHSYGSVVALDDVNLALSKGVVGLLGPNGAGKSTLLNIASTALPPQRGRVYVAGHGIHRNHDRDEARRLLGYLPQRFNLMNWATCLRNATYAAWAQGLPPEECEQRAREALRLVDLEGLAERQARKLSGGQRQRLGIACAMVHSPRVLFLDEPTVGLDPVQRSELREHLRVIGADRTVLLSTHIVEDLDRIADRLLVLNNGRIILDGTRDEFIAANTLSGGERSLESAYVRLMRNVNHSGLATA